MKTTVLCECGQAVLISPPQINADLQLICDHQAAEIERLHAIVDRLPKTADGVPIAPGDELWCIDSEDGWEGAITVRDVECVGKYGEETSCWLIRSTGRNELWAEDCYSTREAAAEAARTEVGE